MPRLAWLARLVEEFVERKDGVAAAPMEARFARAADVRSRARLARERRLCDLTAPALVEAEWWCCALADGLDI